MTTATLETVTPAATAAINDGYVVIFPIAVLADVADSARGRLWHLEQHLREHGVRGAVEARGLASLERVVVWSSDAYFQLLGPHAESVNRRVTEIQMHGPDSRVARRFLDDECALPDTPLTVLRCDPNGARL